MLTNPFAEIALIGLTALAVWLAWRALNTKRIAIKWTLAPVAVISAIALGLLCAVIARGMFRIYAPVDRPVPDVSVAITPERIARGVHLARAVCAGCHAPNGDVPLIGGRDLAEDVPAPIGSLVSLNLTPGGELKDWSDGEIVRALRDGVHKNGRPLLMETFGNTSPLVTAAPRNGLAISNPLTAVTPLHRRVVALNANESS